MDLLPIKVVFVDRDGRPVYKQMYKDLTGRLCAVGKYTLRIIGHMMSEEEFDWDAAQVTTLYRAWLKTMIEDAPTLNEVKRYEFNVDEETELLESIRLNINASIFAELSRMHFILHHDTLVSEHAALLNYVELPTRDEQKRLLTMWSLNLTESQLWTDIPLPDEIDWDVPVLKYTQKEVIAAVMLLCEIVNDLGSISKPSVCCPYEEGTREFMEYFRALFTRNAVFMCQASCEASILNVPDMRVPIDRSLIPKVDDEEKDDEDDDENRMPKYGDDDYIDPLNSTEPCRPSYDYFVWCSYYFGAIMRRIYYWESLKDNVITPTIVLKDGELDRCINTLSHMVKTMGDDAFDDCYTGTCDEAYAIPGDSEWFAYKYPTKQPAMGNILYQLRPELNKRYWKEGNVALDTVLSASRQPRPSYFMHTNQLFIINALDGYFRASGVMWRNAAVVSQEGIELSAWKLSRPTCPVLLQVFSRWWVYNDLFYQPCDDIYEAIAVWFRILRQHYDDTLFSISLADVANKILL